MRRAVATHSSTLAEAHVLVVDDSRAIHDQVREVLTAAGCTEIDHAGSAREAITFYEAKRPDLLFVDLLMPGADGAAMCRELLARHPKANLVVLTALPPRHPKVVDALAQGARAVIHKPVSARGLLEALHRVLAC